jgi:hypothetical protein
VVSITAPGTDPEGFAIAPNGKWAVAPLIEGTDAKPTDWNHTKGGHAALMSIGAQRHADGVGQGAAWRIARLSLTGRISCTSVRRTRSPGRYAGQLYQQSPRFANALIDVAERR